MNKKFKRVGSLCLAGLLGGSAAVMASCGAKEDSRKSTSSVLNIKIFNGGLGYDWLEEIAKDFMKTFENVSFEDGKKGVYISITPNKQFTDLHQNMASGADREDIYYTADSKLYQYTSLGVAYDLTDIMTANVYDETGNVELDETGRDWKKQTRSLADRINVDYYKDSFNLGTEEEPSYYSIPYEDTITGIIVDWDLFKEEGWNNYSGLDGMPGTFTEFKQLLLRIQDAGYSAFTYSNSVSYYTKAFQRAVQAKVDGVEWYNDAYSDYTYEYDFNGDGTITEDEKVTPDTMEKTIDTKGMKKTVEMAYEMFKKDPVSNATFYDPNVTQGVSFGGAQQDFVMSKNSNNRPRIAMIYEGEWWENEVRATFNSMGRLNEEDGYGKREFRMMPIPKMTDEDKSQKYTLGSMASGCVTLVNQKTVGNNPVKQELVKLWLQYQYSEKGLKCFTSHNGSTLPFDYQMDASELAKMTPFARNLWDLKHSDQVEIVYDSPMMQSDQVRLGTQLFDFATKLDGTSYDGYLFSNFVNFRQAGKNYTVEQYLQGMHAYYDGKFATAYGTN